jgi:hypothetical protein
MNVATTTLRPGFLVQLKTTVRGNVHYVRTDIAPELPADASAEERQAAVDRWQTTRTIDDPRDYKAARTARSKAAGLIRSCCSQTAFGLLCPEVDQEKLEAAVGEARKVVDDFNVTSSISTIAIFVLKGRVMPDDVEAVRAINSEIRELMADMAAGVENGNVELAREAASKIKGIGEMLATEAQTKVEMAVKITRDAAKAQVRDRERGGGDGTVQVDKSAVRRINELRAAFVDLDDAVVAAPKAAAPRQLDLAGE